MSQPSQNPSDPIQIFDRKLRFQRFERIRDAYKDHNFLLQWANKQITERLDDIKRNFPVAVSIGPAQKAADLKTSQKIQTLFTLGFGQTDIQADCESLPLKNSQTDLIIDSLNLHTINDLPGLLIQIRRALKPDGLFIAAMFGGETLYELRESLTQAELSTKGGLSPRIFPFADKQQMGALMQRAGFALPVIDSELITVTYDNMFKLMHDLRGMGENNIIHERARQNPGKSLFFQAAEYYAQNFSETDGRIRATFEIIFLIGWAPHESQQKPLKPGSAENRLADALKTEEHKTGETP